MTTSKPWPWYSRLNLTLSMCWVYDKHSYMWSKYGNTFTCRCIKFQPKLCKYPWCKVIWSMWNHFKCKCKSISFVCNGHVKEFNTKYNTCKIHMSDIFTSFPLSFHIKHLTLFKQYISTLEDMCNHNITTNFANLSLSSKDLHVWFECHKERARM
jgi:hypothetical protein